jgi:hypothetical protein
MVFIFYLAFFLKFLSDGVKLAPEDEKFIKEKVLEHHPEKQRKVSGDVDHILVWFLMLFLGYVFTMILSYCITIEIFFRS